MTVGLVWQRCALIKLIVGTVCVPKTNLQPPGDVSISIFPSLG